VTSEPKFFTLEEAEGLIPWLTVKLNAILDSKDAIEELVSEYQEFAKMIEVTSEEGFQFLLGNNVRASKQFHQACLNFYQELGEVMESGVIVKDLDQGLIDFKHKFGEREILLCWKLGEKNIQHWHENDGDVEDRKPLMNLDRMYEKE
jgi:hypothetical protein